MLVDIEIEAVGYETATVDVPGIDRAQEIAEALSREDISDLDPEMRAQIVCHQNGAGSPDDFRVLSVTPQGESPRYRTSAARPDLQTVAEAVLSALEGWCVDEDLPRGAVAALKEALASALVVPYDPDTDLHLTNYPSSDEDDEDDDDEDEDDEENELARFDAGVRLGQEAWHRDHPNG